MENLNIERNPSLIEISGFNNLTIIQEQLKILLNDKLAIMNFNNLTEVKTRFYFLGNNNIENFNGIKNLQKVGGFGLVIEENDNLKSLQGLENLANVNNSIHINNNLNLSDFCALTNLVDLKYESLYINFTHNKYNPSKEDIKNGNCSQ